MARFEDVLKVFEQMARPFEARQAENRLARIKPLPVKIIEISTPTREGGGMQTHPAVNAHLAVFVQSGVPKRP